MTDEDYSFTVVGEPMSKGSTKSYKVKTGRIVTINACIGEKSWAEHVRWTAREHAPSLPWDGPVAVDLEFSLKRPQSLSRKKLGMWAIKGRDLDKMVRSVIDAMTGVFFIDDKQVVEISARKIVADPETKIPFGVVVRVWRMPESRTCPPLL